MGKTKKLLGMIILLLLVLTACTSSPTKTIDGEDWDENWIKIGRSMGVENQANYTLVENKDTLAANGLYYATWGIGKSKPFTNENGETSDLYEAQIYALVTECTSEESASSKTNELIQSAKNNYHLESEETLDHYSIVTYNYKKATSPYTHGISAFTTIGKNSICIELTAQNEFTDDLKSILVEFLNDCHYAKDND
ncbi:hypothetical protein P261_01023 [Lachnospiraceae bacterium TWA4]|nr:hypothetical protein P261_01023 [Lachnospiraceae bacterium TWA4]